ncbi:hypothetical protein JQX13_32425 [Archangium violaceum]|uniref:hypothetical protein n=1 Tax=Archangium violaceum TaxID=83451 RepID=UPI00193B3D3C|nr:hypothetical protein [Archangium violaceum]QRK04905.1 hypothetical protein JQX13_32425 [Archangium violaceum]
MSHAEVSAEVSEDSSRNLPLFEAGFTGTSYPWLRFTEAVCGGDAPYESSDTLCGRLRISGGRGGFLGALPRFSFPQCVAPVVLLELLGTFVMPPGSSGAKSGVIQGRERGSAKRYSG